MCVWLAHLVAAHCVEAYVELLVEHFFAGVYKFRDAYNLPF